MAQEKNDAKQLALELDLGTKADTLDFDLKPWNLSREARCRNLGPGREVRCVWCEVSGVWNEMIIVRNLLAGIALQRRRCVAQIIVQQYNISLCDMSVTDKLALSIHIIYTQADCTGAFDLLKTSPTISSCTQTFATILLVNHACIRCILCYKLPQQL